MPRYQYISFSDRVVTAVGHNFSFLDSEQFPKDVRIVRVDYKPSEGVSLRLVIESASYEDRPLEEILAGPGLTVTSHVRTLNTEIGVVQICSYNPVPRWSELQPLPEDPALAAYPFIRYANVSSWK